jgi:hypothetical protein
VRPVAIVGLHRSPAYLVGVDEYDPPIPLSRNSARDAKEIALLLEEKRLFLVRCLSKPGFPKCTSDSGTGLARNPLVFPGFRSFPAVLTGTRDG